MRLSEAVDIYVAEAIVKGNFKYLWTQALRSVGYKQNYISSHGTDLWTKDSVQKVIQEAQKRRRAKVEVTLDSIRAKCQELQKLAKEKGDLASYAAGIKLEGQTIAAFSEKLLTGDIEKGKEVEESLRGEAKKIASILIDKHKTALIEGEIKD